MKLFLQTFIFFLLASTMIGQEYKRIAQDQKIKGEQTYILPKAAFLIEIPYIKTTLVSGKELGRSTYSQEQLEQFYAKYGLDSVKYKTVKDANLAKKKETIIHKIIEDSIKITLKSVPDYTKIFYVDPDKGWNKNQTVSFTYGTDGILSEGESSLENKTFDIVVKSLSGVAAIAGSFFTGRGAVDSKGAPVVHKIENLDKALNKFEILERQNNYDIYKDLKAKYEKEYEEVFGNYFYKEKKEAYVLKFLYIPPVKKHSDIINSEKVVLFRFDKDSGKIFFSTGLENQIITKDQNFGPPSDKSYVLIFEKQQEQQLNYIEGRGDDEKGFAFNIPLHVQVKLNGVVDTNKVIYYESAKIPQFGVTGYSKAKNKKLSFQLDPISGELKKLTIEGKAVTTDQAASVSPLIIDAVKLAQGDSPATKLDNEVKELENIKKKRDLLKELEVQ